MKKFKKLESISLQLPNTLLYKLKLFLEKYNFIFVAIILSAISVTSFIYYYQNGLGLAYNDARSHLDIARRVVESLKPGFAQLGSVWLPLPHVLMIPTIRNDFMWHSGLSGAIQSMICYVLIGLLIYKSLEKLGVGILGRIVGVGVFALNLNILYLQATPMTELLLLFTLTAGVYELINWHRDEKLYSLLKAAFWIMLSTLVRYDGWFLFAFASGLVILHGLRKRGFRVAEGMFFFFATLGGAGIILWFLWNLAIFKDPLYFAYGPFSAHAQQEILDDAGVLASKGNILLSLKVYFYALVYNSGIFSVMLGIIGAVLLWLDKKIPLAIRIGTLAFVSPLIFNVIALYLGHSVLFVQGISGNTWFNVRYGVMMIPSIAVFIGFLIHKARNAKVVLICLLLFVTFFSFNSYDAVTIDDATVGSSQKNVSEVSSYLEKNAKDKKGYILISAASHDAIIFSSNLPMSKYIHEGTGRYWEEAVARPDKWARYIIMRTNDETDLTFRSIKKTPGLKKFELVETFPFADIYELKKEYRSGLQTEEVFKNQK